MKTKLVLSGLSAAFVFTAALGAAVFTFPGAYGPAQPAMAAEVTWHNALDKGIAEAKSSKKFVFVDVYTDWCGWCKRLDKDTFADSGFSSYLSDKFIAVKLNAEANNTNARVAKDAKVDGYPCGLVYNSDGKLIGKIGGYQKPAEYKATLESILARYAKNPNVDALQEDQ